MKGINDKGIIIKGIGGFYSVLTDDGNTYVCKARGLFRKQQKTPVIGDWVEFDHDEESGYLIAILPRRNELVRPAVANIDKLFIVISASRPSADLLLVDKLIICCEKLHIMPIIVINKCDDAPNHESEAIVDEYRLTDYPIYKVSAATGDGLDALKNELRGSIVCLAGQSAVGKSSLLNAIIPGIKLAVGDLSRKTERGRHTTRHAELIPLNGSGAVLDTPGFSLLDSIEVEPEEIKNYYPELRRHKGECRFNGCLHVTEPGCAVKQELLGNGFNKERYSRYVRLVNEAVEIRRHRYD
ncbi:MAG: ribosome small subunit-dependent GTPase A [Christensenellaceae bacterium]|nr:ribosome small subunit-dependent GTPase A [Christensenellaceae bacterium]